ncbi:MAG: GUN4 domain-containing protein [Prochloraceae cyanobacterium]|nr:GUN4 domain-containing protein [Prochloraceae cyanobacterium]
MSKLVIFQEGTIIREFILKDDWISIGRSPDNILILDEPFISRFHAVISKKNNGYVVTDLDSTEGTYLTDANYLKYEQLSPHKSQKLADGDIIKIGNFHIMFSTQIESSNSFPEPTPPIIEPISPARNNSIKRFFQLATFTGIVFLTTIVARTLFIQNNQLAQQVDKEIETSITDTPVDKEIEPSITDMPVDKEIESSITDAPVKLQSDTEIDYTQLRDRLKIGNWQKADEETYTLMLKAANIEKGGDLTKQSIKNFSCNDLKTIDNLWNQYSQGRFGFRVQNNIYQSLGKSTNALGSQVGWRINRGQFKHYNSLTFDLNAPKGHLPARVFRVANNSRWSTYTKMKGILDRTNQCKITSVGKTNPSKSS